jgi:hypothetical protein
MAKPNPQATRWAFTTPEDDEGKNWNWLGQAQFDEDVIVMIVGKEIGKTTDYPHFQGYIEMHTKKTLWQMKRLLGPQTHLEVAAGTKADNVKYCMKEKNVLININTESKKKQLEDSRTAKYIQLMRDARTLEWGKMEQIHPVECFHHREKLQKIRLEQITTTMKEWDGLLHTKNFWIYGEPGIGKSRWARMNLIDYGRYNKSFNKWWCGFRPELDRLVVIDDWPCAPQGDCLVQHLKIWGDRYPFIAETKGSGIPVEPGRIAIIITSNYGIEEAFSREQDKDAIKRRFRELNMNKNNKTVIEAMRIDGKVLAYNKENETEVMNEEELMYTEEEIETRTRERETEDLQEKGKEKYRRGNLNKEDLDDSEEW